MEADEFAVTKNYSLTIKHIARVQQLAEKLSELEGRKVSQAEVMRMAIDELYEKVEARTLKIGNT